MHSKGDRIHVRGHEVTVTFVPTHGKYIIVENDKGFKFHAFPEMIDTEEATC